MWMRNEGGRNKSNTATANGEREKNDQANQMTRNQPLTAAAAAMTTTQPEAVTGREGRRQDKKKGTDLAAGAVGS